MKFSSFLLLVFFSFTPQLISNTSNLEYPKVKACYRIFTCFELEHANTPKRRSRGLMFRESLDKKKGMLFSWERPRFINMWMKNTQISLDMIWLNSEQEILCLKKNTKPFDLTPIGCNQKAIYVIELNAGSIKKYQIKKGKRFRFKSISELQ